MSNTINKVDDNLKSSMFSIKRQKLIFYIIMMFLPMLHIAIFYFYVNFNSFLMAFQYLDYNSGGYAFNGFQNFIDAFNTVNLGSYFSNSLLAFVVEFLVGTLGSVFFSYYI